MSGFPPNSQSAFDKNKAEGLLVVYPGNDQLQIDIDSLQALEIFQKNIAHVREYFGVNKVEVHPSKSGGDKRHITVTLSRPVASDTERILLQAVLGSDGVRELLSYVQVLANDPYPVLFLEKPLMAAAAPGSSVADSEVEF